MSHDLRNTIHSIRTRKSSNRRVVYVKASTPYTACDDGSPQGSDFLRFPVDAFKIIRN